MAWQRARLLGAIGCGVWWLAGGGGPLQAGQAPAAQESPAAVQTALNIIIVEGEGAINSIKQRTARDIIVHVEDENRRPVAGAVVVFTLPARGPGGTFVHGGKILSVLTDQSGAVKAALKPNHLLGGFKVNVSASLHGKLAATATISQTNALAGVAAGAGAGAATTGAAGGAAAGGTAAGAGAAAGISAGVIGAIVAGAAAVAVGVGVAVAKGNDSSSSKTPAARIGVGGPVVVGPPH